MAKRQKSNVIQITDPKDISESAFQSKILTWLRLQPNTIAEKYPAGGYTRSGVPDIIASVDGLTVWIEVKKESGRLEPIQVHRIKEFRDKGNIVVVIKPSNINDLYFVMKNIEYYKRRIEE